MDLANLEKKGGLSSLLAASGGTAVQILPLDCIVEDSEQVRPRDSDALKDESLSLLADSIAQIGVQEPIIVRPRPDPADPAKTLQGQYMIVCGERRFQASKKAGKADIPAIVRADLTPDRTQDIKILQVTENAQREDIKPMDLALAVRKLEELGLQKKDIAKAIGKRKDYMTYLSAMLNLPPFLMNEYKAGHLSDSPRTCWMFSQAYAECPDQMEMLITEYLGDLKDDELQGCLDRGAIERFQDELKHMGCKEDPAYAATREDADDSIEDQVEPEEDAADADESADQGGSAPAEENPDEEGRSHSAAPSMAPASQGNDAPTAGLGKPDFTDSDTRPDRDLSGSVGGDDDLGGSGPDEEPDRDQEPGADEGQVKFRRFYVRWRNADYKLTQIRGGDDCSVVIVDDAGNEFPVPMNELQLVRGEI